VIGQIYFHDSNLIATCITSHKSRTSAGILPTSHLFLPGRPPHSGDLERHRRIMTAREKKKIIKSID